MTAVVLIIPKNVTQDDIWFLPGVIVLMTLGSVVYAWFSRRPVVRRHLNKIPNKKMGDFRDGESGKITGKVVMAGNYFEAPLSKRNCVYYRIVVAERRSARIAAPYREIIDIEEAADVVMTDGKDYAVIEASKAKCYLVPDSNYQARGAKELKPEFREFLLRHNPESVTFWGMAIPRRFYEGILAPDEKFAVCGYGEWKDAREFEFELPVQRVLFIKPGLGEQVMLSDDPDMVNSE